jgi:hypothetical protein
MDLCALLGAELRRRRERNPRYSLRAFARQLGTHHSTLSQLMARERRLTPRAVRRLGMRLGLAPAQIEAACVAENAAALLRLLDAGGGRLRPDSRWIATVTGIPLDDVDVALHHLLWQRRLTMHSPDAWTGATPR